MKILAKQSKRIAFFLIAVMVGEIVSPLSAFALTGGPSQPEVQSFSPVSSSDMVDLFTGDFNYNIPLMDVDGYPLNLSYAGGITMDQEASWVGLGWNLNPGVINRNMRGIPDDFSGDEIKSQTKMKTNSTYTLGVGFKPEIFGFNAKNGPTKLNVSAGLHMNNYRGFGFDFGIDPSIGFGNTNRLNVGLGLNFSSSDGFSGDINVSAEQNGKNIETQAEEGTGISASLGYNSRGGLKSLNTGMNMSCSQSHIDNDFQSNTSSEIMGSNQTFGTQTHSPNISGGSRSDGVSFSLGFGKEVIGFHVKTSVNGSVSMTHYDGDIQAKKAYGYLFAEKKEDTDVLLDFNREKDIPFIETAANLPLPVGTYDIFSVSAQGMGGSFRTYRNDFPMFHDDRKEQNFTKNSNKKKLIQSSLGLELGAGARYKFGVNLSMIFNKTFSGMWETDNPLKDKLNFTATASNGAIDYEPGYFKMLGESSPLKTGTLGVIGNKNLVYPVSGLSYLSSGLADYNSLNNPNSYNLQISNTSSNKLTYNVREKRNKLISYLNADEAQIIGLDKNIFTMNVSMDNSGAPADAIPISRTDENKKGHHLSEITVTGEDGQRFVYGIPAYNNLSIEATFAITPTGIGASAANIIVSSGQVEYQTGDNSTNNSKGTDNYYSCKKTPAYSHSFLLTGVLSPDFVDVTNDGITDDDLGNATKFSYQRVHENFKWRVPYLLRRANHQEGIKSSTLDDKASYLYGEKEVWHLREVEGKNHIAVFELEARKDGYGVNDSNGGRNNAMQSYMLKKMTLYAKNDYKAHGTSAYPIKTVHFEYDYSLCKNVENNDWSIGTDNINHGKLTLKSLYFTYGRSNKGRLSPYTFNYSSHNPYYNLKGNDRWGTFKPNSGTMDMSGKPNNAEYPYTSQIKDSADLYASAWCLNEIVLPSGGKIQITYEADDYAYVQDKKVMHMFQLEGFSKEPDLDKSDLVSTLFAIDKKEPIQYIYFKLDKQISGGLKDEEFRKQYIDDITEFQFDLLAQVSRSANSANNESYEFVKLYAKIDPSKCGVTDDGLSGYLYMESKAIKAKKEDNDPKKLVNPLAKGIWQFIKDQVPYQLHPLSDKNRKYDESKDRKVIATMATAFSKISKIFSGGLENYLFNQGFGSKVKLNKSWVRMLDPDGVKHGGGQRVKRITMNDDWAAMSDDKGAENQTYGQEYIYQTRDTIMNRTISSGVAAYEPGIGSDENPFRMPTSTVEDLKWSVDIIHSNDEPLGENYSPAPVVGYSEIKIIPLIPSGILKQQTGYTLNTFYTAKDFPFKVAASVIDKDKIEPIFGPSFEKKIYHTTVSQGYLIETNDMHGKPKGQIIFNRFGSRVSGSDNIYAFEPSNPKMLNNKVKTIKNNGTLEDAEFGVTVDFYSDVRESTSKTLTSNAQFNTDIFSIGPIVVPILTLFIIPKQEERIFQSAVVVKHVNRIGILKKTLAYQENASIVTKNLLYDYETGAVLLTSVQNEFHDNIYNFTYPAHWAYDKGMGQAYKNTGLVISGVNFVSGIPKLSGSNLNTYLIGGDECLIYKEFEQGDPEVGYAYLGSDNIINFINQYGNPIYDGTTTNHYTVKVFRSGRRNMQSTPVGSVTTLKNPIKSGILQFDSILNSSAVECSDNWKVNCYEIGQRTEVCDSNLDFINGFNALFNILPNTNDSVPVFSDASSIYNSSYFFRHHYKELCRQYWIDFNNLALYNSNYTDNRIYRNDTTLNSFCVSFKLINDMCGCTPNIPFLNFKFFSANSIAFNQIARFINVQPYKIGLISGSPSIKHQFKITARLNDSSDVILTGYNDCVEFGCTPHCEELPFMSAINPYKTGLKGNWRKVKDYAFSADRKYQSSKVLSKRDGHYDDNQYTNFWKKNGSISAATGSYYEGDKTNSKWVWTNEVTIYSPHGPELENKNALNIYSSAVYGFRHTLPLAVASNARYRQIGYESFEDESGFIDCEKGHFSFMINLGPNATLDKTTKHSGKTSLKVKKDHVHTLDITWPDTSSESFAKEEASYYNKSKTDCIGTFLPDSGYYILGAWVKDSVSPLDTSFINPEIKVEVVKGGVTTIYHLKATGLIIDGWQRIEGRFKIPKDIASMSFKLISNENNCTWFDDIRVHPVDGNMKSYAYDPLTLRLMADLDENNYASFYEYDLEGNLARLKRETERGIVTIKETKSSIKGTK